MTTSALTWNSGSAAKTTESASNSELAASIHASATSLACVCAASFGAPVVPPVWNSAGEIGRARRVAGEAGRVHAGGQFAEVTDAHPVDGGQRRGRSRRRGRPQHQDGVEHALVGELLRGLPGRGRELRAGGDEHPGAGAAQQLGEVSTVESAVDRCGDAGQLRGQCRGDQLGAVGREEGDRVATAHAEPVQQVRGAVHVGEQLGERAPQRLPPAGSVRAAR